MNTSDADIIQVNKEKKEKKRKKISLYKIKNKTINLLL